LDRNAVRGELLLALAEFAALRRSLIDLIAKAVSMDSNRPPGTQIVILGDVDEVRMPRNAAALNAAILVNIIVTPINDMAASKWTDFTTQKEASTSCIQSRVRH